MSEAIHGCPHRDEIWNLEGKAGMYVSEGEWTSADEEGMQNEIRQIILECDRNCGGR